METIIIQKQNIIYGERIITKFIEMSYTLVNNNLIKLLYFHSKIQILLQKLKINKRTINPKIMMINI